MKCLPVPSSAPTTPSEARSISSANLKRPGARSCVAGVACPRARPRAVGSSVAPRLAWPLRCHLCPASRVRPRVHPRPPRFCARPRPL